MNLTDLQQRVALKTINDQIVSKILMLAPHLSNQEKMTITSDILELKAKEAYIYKSLFKFTDVSREEAEELSRNTSYVLQNKSFLSFIGNFNLPRIVSIPLIFVGIINTINLLKSYLG